VSWTRRELLAAGLAATAGLPKRPTPYDNRYAMKPLRAAIAAALRAAPTRTPGPAFGKT
jgi:endo-1,4-beta-xylanase